MHHRIKQQDLIRAALGHDAAGSQRDRERLREIAPLALHPLGDGGHAVDMQQDESAGRGGLFPQEHVRHGLGDLVFV